MLIHYLFIAVLCQYLIVGLLIFIFKQHRSGILTGFGLLCWMVLLAIGYLSQYTVHSKPVKVEVTNYSTRKGNLYFFRSKDCDSHILYDFAVNANEESSLEIDGGQETFAKVIFRTENGEFFQILLADAAHRELLIWEKELEKADKCYQTPIKAYRRKQLQYAIAIGLLILGTFGMFGAAIRK